MKSLFEYYAEKTGKKEEEISSNECWTLMIALDWFREFNNPKVREIIKEEKQNLKV